MVGDVQLASPQTALANTLYGEEILAWARQFVATGPEAETAPPAVPRSERQVLADIQLIWKDGFLPPDQLKAALVEKYLDGADARVIDMIRDIDADRYLPDRMTGFVPKEHTALATGLAHLYAQQTGNTAAIIEVDFSNMGGTNEHYRQLIANSRGVPIEQVDLRETFEYTDRAARLVAQQITYDLRDIAPNAAIYAVRSGGDEVRVLVAGIDPQLYPEVSRRIHVDIENHMARLGLLDHAHLKDPDNPMRNGFGAAFAIQDLNEHVDPATLVHALDGKIKFQKELLGITRRGPAVLDRENLLNNFREYYEENPNKIPSGQSAEAAAQNDMAKFEQDFSARYNQLQSMQLESSLVPEEQKVYAQEELRRMELPEQRARTSIHNPDISNLDAGLFATPQERRIAYIERELQTRGIEPDSLSYRYLIDTVRSVTPMDPAAGVQMPNDLPATAAGFAADIPAFRGGLDPADPNVARALAQAGMTSMDIPALKPHAMGISFHGLAALNEALGHDNANGILKFQAKMIEEAFRDAGVPPEHYALAHYGGGEFRAIVKPGFVSADGALHLVSDRVLADVESNIAHEVRALRATPVIEFIGEDNLSEKARARLEGKTFADLEDLKFREIDIDGTPFKAKINGIEVVTMHSPVPDSVQTAGARDFMIEFSRAQNQAVENFRETSLRQRYEAGLMTDLGAGFNRAAQTDAAALADIAIERTATHLTGITGIDETHSQDLRFSRSALGSSSAGFGMAAIGLKNAIESDNTLGTVISATDLAASGLDLTIDGLAATGKSALQGWRGIATKANVGVMLVDGVYQISIEEGGMDNKLARGAAVATTTGAGWGIGATAGTIAAGGTATTAAVVAAPVAAAIAVGITADAAVQARNGFADLRDLNAERAQAQVLPGNRIEIDGAPSIRNYRNLAAFAMEISGEATLQARIEHLKTTAFSDPARLAELQENLDARIAEQEQIITRNSGTLPDWMRIFSDSAVDAKLAAETELAPLRAAQAELALYKQNLGAYHTANATRIFENFPSETRANMPPEIQALVEWKKQAATNNDAARAGFIRQYHDLAESGSLVEVMDYMQKNTEAPESTPRTEPKLSPAAAQVSPNWTIG